MNLRNNILTLFNAAVIFVLLFCNENLFSNGFDIGNKENMNISDSVKAEAIPGKTYIDSVDKEELKKQIIIHLLKLNLL